MAGKGSELVSASVTARNLMYTATLVLGTAPKISRRTAMNKHVQVRYFSGCCKLGVGGVQPSLVLQRYWLKKSIQSGGTLPSSTKTESVCFQQESRIFNDYWRLSDFDSHICGLENWLYIVVQPIRRHPAQTFQEAVYVDQCGSKQRIIYFYQIWIWSFLD